MSVAVLEIPVAREPRRRSPHAAFLGGVALSQVVNSALHLAQPLLMVQLTGSLGKAAFFSAFDTAVHMTGTFLGGWPADRIGARRLLIISTVGRGVALAAIPVLWALGALTPLAAMAAYTADAFVRGFTDTAVHALPLELAGHERAELDSINARYEFAFDMGGVAGPLLLGAAIVFLKGMSSHVLIAAGFVAAAGAFALIPRRDWAPSRQGGTVEGLRAASSSALLWPCLGVALLNLYPLRKLLSAFFAKALLSNPASAGWVGAAFGLGGALGSLVYARWAGRGSGAGWVWLGALGVLVLAGGWIPGSLWVMMGAAFLFSAANVGARLSLTRSLQQATPLEIAGGVTAVARFGSNIVSVLLKALIGLAFALGAGARTSFAVVGAGLGLVALLQMALASRIMPKYRNVP